MKKRILITLGAAAIIVITGMIYVFADEQTQQIHLPPAGTEGLISSEVSDANISALLKKLEDSGQIPKLDRSDSLGGPDANGDGIRDDIEALIVSLKRSPEETKALRQYALTIQNELTGQFRSKDEIYHATDKLSKAIGCVLYRFNDNADKYIQLLGSATRNTRVRKLEENRLDQLASGMVFKTYSENGCETEETREWCTENHFGEWLTWRAKPPEVVPLTEAEYDAAMKAGADLQVKLNI